jgi:MOSC domain-containing protein YiiM
VSRVVGVHRSTAHTFSKASEPSVVLLAGLGVEGDAHAGTTVQHRSRDGVSPNLRQVHLMADELLDELDVPPGALGENVTTHGLDLISLPVGTRLRLGPDAVVELTGLRNPCRQIDAYRPGLLKQVVGHDETGALVRRAGVMSVVVTGGTVRAGDAIVVDLPVHHVPLEVV